MVKAQIALLKKMQEDVSEIKADIEVIQVKLDMLQRVVYGTVSVILLAVVTAGMKFLLVQ